MVTLGETFDFLTLAALLLIVGGIAIGIIPSRGKATPEPRPTPSRGNSGA
jgi:hypothetical protein